MTFGQAVNSAFSKTFVYKGRASRSEYWWFFLFSLLAMGAALFIDFYVISERTDAFFFIPILFIVVTLALVPTSISLSVRRLHDISASGWWVLLIFLPYVGFVLWILALIDGKLGDNKYGPNPKGFVPAPPPPEEPTPSDEPSKPSETPPQN